MLEEERTKKDIQGDIDALSRQIDELRKAQSIAPLAKNFATFQRSEKGEWYGPYWMEDFQRPRDFNRLATEYSWNCVMVYSVAERRVVQLVSDMKAPIQSIDKLHEICRTLIKAPNH